MAKITIEIYEKENGAIGISFSPTREELKAHVKKVGIENTTMLYHYAKAADALFRIISNNMDKADPEASKEKSKLWMPALENVAKIWNPY